MKMAEIVMKSIGLYLLAIMESIVVFLAFMLGKWTNGLEPALALLIGSLLAATQVLFVFLIKYYFKIAE